MEDTFHVAVNTQPTAWNFVNTSTYNLPEDNPTAFQFTMWGNPGAGPDASQTITFHVADLSSLHGKLYSDSGLTHQLSVNDTITAAAPGIAQVYVYYKPDLNYSGPMSFQYYVTDNGGGN